MHGYNLQICDPEVGDVASGETAGFSLRIYPSHAFLLFLQWSQEWFCLLTFGSDMLHLRTDVSYQDNKRGSYKARIPTAWVEIVRVECQWRKNRGKKQDERNWSIDIQGRSTDLPSFPARR